MSLDASTNSTTLPAAKGLGFVLRNALMDRLCAGVRVGTATIRWPDGAERRYVGGEPGQSVTLHLRDWRALRRVVLGGALGFADAYIAGEIETDDLRGVIEFALDNEAAWRGTMQGTAALRLVNRLVHLVRPNSKRGSRRNIAAHYDLGNEFYRLWLDETMSYSAGQFAALDETLETSQLRKYRSIAALAGIKPGHHVLELGCGWGGFAELAAEEGGARVTGITLSERQLAFARARMAQAGLGDRVALRLQDYRDCAGAYDAVVSIEMFEAVGEKNWPLYFRTVRDCLKSGAKAALQVITIAEDRYPSYRASADFIQRYIFPGGMLPTRKLVEDHARRAGLTVLRSEGFGADYAHTLALWAERFHARWPAIEALGFDARFRRMWDYYFRYCEAGFRSGTIDVVHFQLARG